MSTFLEALNNQNILVSDGAWGTLLMKEGLTGGECPELWNLHQPDKVEKVARAYVEAGSDIIETNSFGGSRIKLEHYGKGNQSHQINKLAAEISKKAAGDKAFVMGSVGPSGKLLLTGEVTEAQLYDAFAEQASGLMEGGADVLIVETMTDLEEAGIAISACKENTGLPVVCSMSFESAGKDNYATMMGITPMDFVSGVAGTGIHVIGSNCGKGTTEMMGIAKQLKEHSGDLPVLIQANAGIPYYKNGEVVFPDGPEDWVDYIQELIKLNIKIIGGCCGTNPDFIRKIRMMVDSLHASH